MRIAILSRNPKLYSGAIAADLAMSPGVLAAEERRRLKAQLAFLGRAPEERIRSGLDALHQAVFEDMAEHGTPTAQLPIFEQLVSARYAEYHQAAAESDGRLGEAVCKHLTGQPEECMELAIAMTERAVAVAKPLRDFLEEVELVA